jgi:integrase
VVDVGAGLGLRQGEIFGLAVEEVDFLRGWAPVRRQVKILGGKLAFASPKRGKDRDVPLPESVALRLAAHLQAWPAVAVTLPWLPTGKPETVRLLFTTRERTALDRTYGLNPKAVADWLGHADPGFTLRVYGHVMPASEDRARAAIDRALGGGPRALKVPSEGR